MELLKLLSANEVIAQIISFLILFFLLRIFLWKKILISLDQRKERIARELKDIEEGKAEIARIRREYEDNLAQAASKAKAVIQEAHSEGREITAEIRKKAFEEAQDIIEAARKSVRHELAKAKEELKDEIIDLTLKATENIIQEKLTEEGDRRLVDNFLKTINTL